MINHSVGHGTHLPMLMWAMDKSIGPVLECGAGFFSTPFLHWKTYLQNRKLTTLEGSSDFIKFFDRYNTDWHKVVLVSDWDSVDISGRWGVALIDHAPNDRRVVEIQRLAYYCDFIVVHDTEGRRENVYHYSSILKTFKYRKDFTLARPHTSVVSNFVDLAALGV